MSLLGACCECLSTADDVCSECQAIPDCPDTFCGANLVNTFTVPTPAFTGPDLFVNCRAPGDIPGAYGPLRNAQSILSFGDQPPGTYYLKYCGGALKLGSFMLPNTEDPSVSCLAPAYVYGIGNYTLTYNDECSGNTITRESIDSGQYDSEADTAIGMSGAFDGFVHSGGPISLTINPGNNDTVPGGAPPPPNASFTSTPPVGGSPNPQLGLYYLPFPTAKKITLVSACAVWTNPGVAANVTITVRNRNCLCYGGVSATLDQPGSGIVFASLPSLANTDLTFSFEASNVGIEVTLTLTSATWGADVQIKVYLAPAIMMSYQPYPGVGGGRGLLTFTNVGNWTINPTSTNYTYTNGYGFCNGGFPQSCQNPHVDNTAYTAACGGGSFFEADGPGGSLHPGLIIISGNAVTANNTTLTATLKEGPVTYTPVATNITHF